MISEYMVCLKWTGDGRKIRNICKKHYLNREELKPHSFCISARRREEREEKGRKRKLFCNHLTEHLLRCVCTFPTQLLRGDVEYSPLLQSSECLP